MRVHPSPDLGLLASKGLTSGKQTNTNPKLSEANPTPFPKPTQLAFQAVGEILRMSQQEFRGRALKSRSVPLKQFCVNNLFYQSRVAQIPICLIMDANLQHREKKSPSLKNCCFKTPSCMIFTSQPCLFKADLVGAFFYKCKYNYCVCISVHPKMVKDNTVALTITIPSLSSPAELQMLLH